MNSSSMKATKISAKELAELSLLCALMFVGKEVMNFIPNVHPVTVIIMFTVIRYGWKAMYPVMGFTLLEIAVFGFGMWTLMYIYIWPLLVAVSMPVRDSRNWILWAIVAGMFGLCFGALCSIPYLFTSGVKAAISFWIAGIPFDIIHGISNFVLTIIFLPLLNRLKV